MGYVVVSSLLLVPHPGQQQHRFPLCVVPTTKSQYCFFWMNPNFVVLQREKHEKDDDEDPGRMVVVVVSFDVPQHHHTTTTLRQDLRIQRYVAMMQLLVDIHRQEPVTRHNRTYPRS